MEVIATEFFSALKIVLKYGYIFFPPFAFITALFSGLVDVDYFGKVLVNSLLVEAVLVFTNIALL
ncbi:MAG: hypothetical protein U0L26_10765 [Cellulosilyticum sp.]|nr:hypothetical protein [Cellulosilyticum sp.]